MHVRYYAGFRKKSSHEWKDTQWPPSLGGFASPWRRIPRLSPFHYHQIIIVVIVWMECWSSPTSSRLFPFVPFVFFFQKKGFVFVVIHSFVHGEISPFLSHLQHLLRASVNDAFASLFHLVNKTHTVQCVVHYYYCLPISRREGRVCAKKSRVNIIL